MIAHPFRFVSGRIAPQVQGSPAHAAQLAGHVLSTQPGERPLAPGFGLPDLSGSVTDPATVTGVLRVCAPDLAVQAVSITPASASGFVDVAVTVTWDQED